LEVHFSRHRAELGPDANGLHITILFSEKEKVLGDDCFWSSPMTWA